MTTLQIETLVHSIIKSRFYIEEEENYQSILVDKSGLKEQLSILLNRLNQKKIRDFESEVVISTQIKAIDKLFKNGNLICDELEEFWQVN